MRSAMKWQKVKQNGQELKSAIGRAAILHSVAKEGLSNKVTSEKFPEVRSLSADSICVRNAFKEESTVNVQRPRGGNMFRHIWEQIGENNEKD